MNLTAKNFYNFNYQKILLLLFFLTPSIIFISKFAADLFLSIISISSIFLIIKHQKFREIKLVLPFFIFIFYVTLNSLIQQLDLKLFLKSFFLIRFPLFLLFPLLTNFKFEEINIYKKYFFFMPLIIFLVNMYSQLIFKHDIFGNIFENDYQRISSFFGDEYVAGAYLFFVFFIILFSIKKFDYKELFLLIIIYLSIFFSGDRTPFININFCIFIYFIFNYKKILSDKKIKSYVLIFIIFFSSLFYLHLKNYIKIDAFNKYQNTIKDIKNDLSNEKNEGNKLGIKRWAYYGMFYKSYVILENNLFFGSSYKTYRIECKNSKYDERYYQLTNNLEYGGCSTHPHNIYAEILSEQGVIGFILFLILILSLFKLSSFSLKTKYSNLLFKIFIFVHFFPLKPFGSFYTNFGLIMFSASIAFFLIFNQKKNE